MKSFIRVFKEVDIDEISGHLIIAGDLSANCFACNHIGIDFQTAKSCPNCHREFKYITFRPKANKAEEFSQIGRLKEKRPDLIIIDHADFTRSSGKIKAHDIFTK